MRKVVVTYSHVTYLGQFIRFMKFFAGLEIKLRSCLSSSSLLRKMYLKYYGFDTIAIAKNQMSWPITYCVYVQCAFSR